MARPVQYLAASITPARSGWSLTSSRATSSGGRPASTFAADSASRSVSRSRSLVRPHGERAQVDVHRLGGAEQRGQRGGAERRVRVAFAGGPLDVRDKPSVRGFRRLPRRRVGVRRYPGGQPPDAAEQ